MTNNTHKHPIGSMHGDVATLSRDNQLLPRIFARIEQEKQQKELESARNMHLIHRILRPHETLKVI